MERKHCSRWLSCVAQGLQQTMPTLTESGCGGTYFLKGKDGEQTLAVLGTPVNCESLINGCTQDVTLLNAVPHCLSHVSHVILDCDIGDIL